MRRPIGIALGSLLVLAVAAAAAVELSPDLIEITSPAPDLTVGDEALEVFVLFPAAARTRPETLRVLLNGADVTRSFTVASNGAYGHVVLLVDGENTLEVGIFGQAWWQRERLYEHTAHLRFTVRRPVERDWAEAPRGKSVRRPAV